MNRNILLSLLSILSFPLLAMELPQKSMQNPGPQLSVKNIRKLFHEARNDPEKKLHAGVLMQQINGMAENPKKIIESFGADTAMPLSLDEGIETFTYEIGTNASIIACDPLCNDLIIKGTHQFFLRRNRTRVPLNIFQIDHLSPTSFPQCMGSGNFIGGFLRDGGYAIVAIEDISIPTITPIQGTTNWEYGTQHVHHTGNTIFVRTENSLLTGNIEAFMKNGISALNHISTLTEGGIYKRCKSGKRLCALSETECVTTSTTDLTIIAYKYSGTQWEKHLLWSMVGNEKINTLITHPQFYGFVATTSNRAKGYDNAHIFAKNNSDAFVPTTFKTILATNEQNMIDEPAISPNGRFIAIQRSGLGSVEFIDLAHVHEKAKRKKGPVSEGKEQCIVNFHKEESTIDPDDAITWSIEEGITAHDPLAKKTVFMRFSPLPEIERMYTQLQNKKHRSSSLGKEEI